MVNFGWSEGILGLLELHIILLNSKMVTTALQIADFGMSRDLDDHQYYITSGGKIPVKWTAPEVSYYALALWLDSFFVDDL